VSHSLSTFFLDIALTGLGPIGLTAYTTPGHIARATLEAAAFQTRAIIGAMAKDSGVDLQYLKVDGGMTNGDLAMQLQADIGGFEVVRPEMRESVLSSSSVKVNYLTYMITGLPLWDLLSSQVRLSGSLGGTSASPRRSTKSTPRVACHSIPRRPRRSVRKSGRDGSAQWSAARPGMQIMLIMAMTIRAVELGVYLYKKVIGLCDMNRIDSSSR
jgi:hypothetical protein